MITGDRRVAAVEMLSCETVILGPNWNVALCGGKDRNERPQNG